MADKISFVTTLNPQSPEIDFLTDKINEESEALGIAEKAYPFGIFIRDTETQRLLGGCNGSIVYGSIYTDQLWVDPAERGKGLGRKLMEKVHQLGREKNCKAATVGTISFQGAQPFYEKLGYQVEFVREGYVNNSTMIYLKKSL